MTNVNVFIADTNLKVNLLNLHVREHSATQKTHGHELKASRVQFKFENHLLIIPCTRQAHIGKSRSSLKIDVVK